MKRKNIVPNNSNNNNSFEIKPQKFELTDKQKQIINTGLDSKNVRCLIINGRAGTSKSYLSVLIALRLLSLGKIPCINYIRSLIQAKDGETGFLTGNLEEKTFYYNIPLYDKLSEFLIKPQIEKLFKEEKIKTYPTSMLRGNQLSGVTIMDESQNMRLESLYTVMTRMAEHSLLIILGDTTSQNDLGSQTGFKRVCEMFNDENSRNNGIFYYELDSSHIVRSKFVKFIVEKFEKLTK